MRSFAIRQRFDRNIGHGVAVIEKRTPLMRLFRANQTHLSEEDRAATMRLTNIASRYRADPSADHSAEPADEGRRSPSDDPPASDIS